jgi:hypothetical protein
MSALPPPLPIMLMLFTIAMIHFLERETNVIALLEFVV